ncbi:MAG: glutamine amidotransferase [Phycisphaerales bacterium]
MMPSATITIPMSDWIWPASVLLLATLVLLAWSYRRSPAVGAVPRIAFGLKLLGIAALAFCLIEPIWSGRRATSGANVVVVAADNSRGMNIRDDGAAQTRGEVLRQMVQTGKEGWLAALGGTFQIRQYLFDSRLRRTSDFSDLTFDGTATSLGAALRTLAERYKGRPLAGVLLLTDGCATDLGEQLPDLSGLPPVYPVVIGRDRPQRDLALANVTISQTPFEDAPVTIQVDGEAAGFAGENVAVELLDGAGNLVERQPWKPGRNEAKQNFSFRLRPDRSGVLFYRLRIADASEDVSQDNPPASSEATLANNARTIVVDRGKGPYRILYVAGRPNWDLKFLKRAIEEDEQVQLVTLIRMAKREPKYDWRGHTGETSNPLYRGFDVQDKEQAEQYDQPVLVRLNTRDRTELHEGFPKTAEELFEYQAIILDDIEAAFFSRDQMDLIRRYVTQRGGGFLMLGGKESFQRGDYQRTPIASILPIYLDPMPPAKSDAGTRLNLTREGWLQPWARLRDNEKDEQQRLAEMPEFQVVNRSRAVKPGARIVATIDVNDSQQLPGLIAQQVGNGRSAALVIGDLWRWGMRKPEMHEDMDKFWRQTLRWLIADVPPRVSLQANHKLDETNQPVSLVVRVRDKAFEPMDNVTVSMEVLEPGGGSVRLAAVPSPTEAGQFEATYVPRASGGYYAHATTTDAKGSRVGEAETGWAVDLEGREFASIRVNRPLLDKIARQTGGRVVEPDELNKFARDLPQQNAPISEVWVRPLWDLPGIVPAVFLFSLACFVAEWALRRWKGLP